MSLFVWECALACGLLVPAQEPPAQTQPIRDTVLVPAREPTNYVVSVQTGAGASRPAIDEEIEVMRTLLLRKLAGAGRSLRQYYASGLGEPTSPYGVTAEQTALG